MSSHDDDLTPWRYDPIIAALTAAGSEAELAGEADALAAFRAAAPARSRRRQLGRLGVGGAAVATAVILSTAQLRRTRRRSRAPCRTSLPTPPGRWVWTCRRSIRRARPLAAEAERRRRLGLPPRRCRA